MAVLTKPFSVIVFQSRDEDDLKVIIYEDHEADPLLSINQKKSFYVDRVEWHEDCRGWRRWDHELNFLKFNMPAGFKFWVAATRFDDGRQPFLTFWIVPQ